MAGAAADAGQAAGAAGHAAGAGELATGATANAGHAALAARTTAGTLELASRAAVPVGVAAAAARVLLEGDVGRRWSRYGNVSNGRGRGGDSRSHSPGDNQRFHECQFR
ncbi:hypothetical protein K883_00150 [Mycobacterium sp. TKK-01-0059]|nr:hypothetical protein K883_00150 [Mycobacterium sp. TKK-01-0059]